MDLARLQIAIESGDVKKVSQVLGEMKKEADAAVSSLDKVSSTAEKANKNLSSTAKEATTASLAASRLGKEANDLAKNTRDAATAEGKLKNELQNTTSATKTATAGLAELSAQAKKSAENVTGAVTASGKLASPLNSGSNALHDFSEVSRKANSSTLAFSQIISDMPYGLQGIANNLDPLAVSFSRLRQQVNPATGELLGTKGAVQAILASVSGPMGLVLGISVVSASFAALGPVISKSMKNFMDFRSEVEKAKEAVEDFSEYKNLELEITVIGLEGLDRLEAKLDIVRDKLLNVIREQRLQALLEERATAAADLQSFYTSSALRGVGSGYGGEISPEFEKKSLAEQEELRSTIKELNDSITAIKEENVRAILSGKVTNGFEEDFNRITEALKGPAAAATQKALEDLFVEAKNNKSLSVDMSGATQDIEKFSTEYIRIALQTAEALAEAQRIQKEEQTKIQKENTSALDKVTSAEERRRRALESAQDTLDKLAGKENTYVKAFSDMTISLRDLYDASRVMGKYNTPISSETLQTAQNAIINKATTDILAPITKIGDKFDKAGSRYDKFVAAFEEINTQYKQALDSINQILASGQFQGVPLTQNQRTFLEGMPALLEGQKSAATNQVSTALSTRMGTQESIIRSYEIEYSQLQKLREEHLIQEDEYQSQRLDLIRSTNEQLMAMDDSVYGYMKQGIYDFAQTFGNTFNEMLWNAETTFDSILDSFMKMITQMVIQAAIVEPLQQGLGSIFGSVTGSANGNIFVNGSIQPFATGGIVTRPTLFQMANGAGLMGEAGPEGILPLKRINGKLGVSAEGVSTPQNMQVSIVNESNQDLEVTASDVSFDHESMIIGVVINAYTKNKMGMRYALGGS